MINLTFYDCGPNLCGDVQCVSCVGEELTPFLSVGKDCGQGWDEWLVDAGTLCLREGLVWFFTRNSNNYGLPHLLCFVLAFSRMVPVVLQGLLSCCVPVYINVSSLLVWTNEKSWSSSKSQIMSQLVPGTRASRELPRQGDVTGL